jgi:DNA-binding transcriptional ArsR family regulator
MVAGMTSGFSIADAASLIGEPTRAAILLALVDGRALPAGELARAAGLSAPATSLHLAKLVGGGLLALRREGRHRYYRLASADVAHALEALGAIATARPPARSVLPGRARLRAARACYDHLAGAVAVALAESLEREHVLRAADDRTYEVTREGARWFAAALRIDVGELARGRRALARRCLDWTERRPHLAGALGAALLDRLVERRWVARTSGSRALRITALGRAEFAKLGLPAALTAEAS